MSKFSLLVMGGAVGLLCSGSPAVLAQVAPPGGSKTNVGETKPPFKIPNGGNFKYKGKSSQGEFLLMEVKWQAVGTQPNTDKTRISGDVKYNNPKTGMVDVRIIDGNKSYITKTGELFFALNDIDGKVYGPVNLAAVDASSSVKPKLLQSNGSGPAASGKVAAPKAQSSDPSINSGLSTTLYNQDTQEDEDASKLDKNSLSAINKRCSFKNAEAYDDRFKASGSFNVGGNTFHWKQQNSTTPKYRRILVRQAKNCAYGSTRDQFYSIIDDDGKVRAYFGEKKLTRRIAFIPTNSSFLRPL